MTRHEWLKRNARRFGRRGVGRFGFQLGVLFALGTSGAFASETGTNLPWEGPLTTLVTSLTGPVAYAISVIAIVALGATLAFAGGEPRIDGPRRCIHPILAVALSQSRALLRRRPKLRVFYAERGKDLVIQLRLPWLTGCGSDEVAQ